jgi:hypothetical protein
MKLVSAGQGANEQGIWAKWPFFITALIALIGLSNFCGCTSNPFGEDDIASGTGTIRGSVQLSNRASPEGVYLWLDGFNLSTRTDASGNFVLTLPPPSAQGSSGGISGVFNLYFYLANYLLASTQVATQKGGFVYARGDLNAKGELAAPKTLQRFLRISTLVAPSSVRTNFTGNINVEVTLEATIDSATVIFPKAVGGLLGAIFIKRAGSEEVFLAESVPGAVTRDIQIIGRAPHRRLMLFNLLQRPLPPAEYEVIPYVLIRHEFIPPGLMASLGANVEDFGPDYLKIPFSREGGRLTVTN